MKNWHNLWDKAKESFRGAVIKYFGNVILVIGTCWILVDAAWTILNIHAYYYGVASLAGNPFLIIFVIVIPVVLFGIYIWFGNKNRKLERDIAEQKEKTLQESEVIQFYRNIMEECFDDIYTNHREVLLKDLEKAFQEQNWKLVIRYGKYASRQFLMLAKYDLRIQCGNYIIQAADQIGESESAALGYIDCIGWSYACKKDYNKSKEYIEKGLGRISNLETEEGIIMKCKANRHLSGIALKQNDVTKAKEYRDIFENHLRKLKGRNKRIMRASLHIIDGDILMADNSKNEKAKKKYEEAYKIFISCNDRERTVKVRNKLGNVNVRLNQKPEALKDYIIGYWEADRISRIDEKKKNCRAICELVKKNNDLLKVVAEDGEYAKQFRENNIVWKKDERYYEESLKQLEIKTEGARNKEEQNGNTKTGIYHIDGAEK